jgi:hypothetical protein
MKKHFFILILVCFVISSCRKPSETPDLTSLLISKEWRVNLVTDNGSNYTYLYNGMKFTFKADSTVKVFDGIATYDGTWSEDKLRQTFFLDIISPRFELDFISQEWVINLKTPGQLQFRDDKFNPTQEFKLNVY